MKKVYKKENTFLSNNTPGIAGIIYCLLTYILGPVVVVATICLVVNFACQFAGVDFDAFQWTMEFISSIPSMIEYVIVWVKNLINNVTQ